MLVFTLEVAISSMSRFVDQFVVLFDASMFFIYMSIYLFSETSAGVDGEYRMLRFNVSALSAHRIGLFLC